MLEKISYYFDIVILLFAFVVNCLRIFQLNLGINNCLDCLNFFLT